MFGYIQSSTIKSLDVENVNINGYQYVGGFVGYSNSSTIEKLNVSGEITGQSTYIGGIVGYLAGGTFHCLSTSIIIDGKDNCVGGIAGCTEYSSAIHTCFSSGTINGVNYVGGLVGYHSSCIITNSYSQANVNGSDRVGGALGSITTNGYTYRCYSKGVVNGSINTGGFIGYNASGKVSDCYWDSLSSGQTTSAGGIGKSTTEMKSKTTYKNYNFYKLWKINEGVDYPTFQDLSIYSPLQIIDLSELSGDGSEGNPYIITNANELNSIRQDLTKHYKLGNDIDMSSSVIWNNGLGWEPIGNSSTKFTGSFDGNGSKINYLTINRPRTTYQGLFGYIQSSTIKSLDVENVNINGYQYVGGLVGHTSTGGVIEDVSINGEIIGQSDYLGGVTGYLSSATINRSSVNVILEGKNNNAGGITGYTTLSVTINSSYSFGNISGVNYVGGLVGYHTSGTINNNYSRAEIYGNSYIGGSLGSISTNGKIYYSYSTGLVTGLGSNIGGFLGYSSGTVSYCYWDTETSGQSSSAGGTGKTSAEMKTQGTFVNWDFVNIWSIASNYNAGYPYLQWQSFITLQLKIFLQGAYK